MRKLFLFIAVSFNFILNSKTDTLRYCEETRRLFNDLTYHQNETGELTKWKRDIKIFVHQYEKNGTENDNETVFKLDYEALKMELSTALVDLNNYIDPIQISIVDKKEESNMEIYIGSMSGCKLLDASSRFVLTKNWAIQHCEVSSDGSEITKAFVFLDLYRTPNLRIKKRLLRKKLAQSLGLFYDTDEVKESIFFSGFSDQINYSEIDKDIIQLLYNFSNKEHLKDQTNDDIALPNFTALSVKTNPFQEELKLECSKILLNQDLKIFNQLGQLVYIQKIESPELTVSTSEFNSGIYFVQVNNEKSIRVIKN